MRDSIRAATVGSAKRFKSKVVRVAGHDIEVRQPSVKARSAIMKAAKALNGDRDKLELAALQVEAVINCSFDPGTNDKVFTEADRESMLETPSGSWLDDLAEAAIELLNVDTEDIEKNSEGTPNAS